MSTARIVLHVGAAAVAAAVACVAVFGTVLVLFGSVDDVTGLWPFAVAAALSAQLAALPGWHVLNRYLRRPWMSAIGAGLLMTLVTHLAFGPMLVVVAWAGGLGPVEKNIDWIGISLYSALFVGWATAVPATLGAAWVGRLRRKEVA